MRFHKYHGLGNDYIVLDPGEKLSERQIRRICHRHYGVGSASSTPTAARPR
jgi:diaminopimelate epimerase